MKSRKTKKKLMAVSMAAAIFLPLPLDSGHAASPSATAKNEAMLVKIHLKNRADLDKLLSYGIDLTENLDQHAGQGMEADAILTKEEMEILQLRGYKTDVISTQHEIETLRQERQFTVQQEKDLAAAKDKVTILRANYFTSQGGKFLYVEAKSDAGALNSTVLTATWDNGKNTAPGSGGTAALERNEDADVYMYHSMLLPVDTRPSTVNITSSLGGTMEAKVTDWIGGKKPTPGKHYVSDFTDHYMTPTELDQRITKLAKHFSSIAEIVELPYETNGYRRKAQTMIGEQANPASAVVLTSKKWGHEGGNSITLQAVKQEGTNLPLTIDTKENTIVVKLATDASGQSSSKAKDVIQKINAESGNLVTATSFRGNSGEGYVTPTEKLKLTDGLKAPESISREPHTMKAIRIGKHRDGSKAGVLLYSQEHAREWVTPLVSVETAERLLRNYSTDKATRKLVNNLDIFIVPSVNPDGATYSFYDYNWQRKNMTNHCGPEKSDPALRNTWGVDLNRNHGTGSVYDGYLGSSTDCQSSVYGGPAELSEPEAKNLIWLADENPNVKFAMNVHSYGGYFMWPPGAYKALGRETLPRPTAGQEAFFWSASERILQQIKEYRGTTILPGRTGPVPDVLYSAAGNSADALWYNYGIYAWDFEVGADLWNARENKWEPVGFQPPFEEGHEEAMEFSNGLIGMMDVAYDYEHDKKAPTSTLHVKRSMDNATLEFSTSEPATIYYTTNNKRPTFSSKKIKISGIREGAEKPVLEQTATVKWFAIDASGNIENHYKPEGKKDNYRSQTVKVK
ncbi:Chitobiase/beta-hexosaminidase C-terminal domain-containing protein [Fictibacillus solisalsi]|uniref:Chitobiase/beta-hexosaminidase C-terminal domain-containing protein n=1 Tax=Fictibacillus solisalsi TaxID=459525 RepID=A0A1G9TAZ1_9BACL|nr:M14 family metallopeptidase [Fictibacillus solisalsi]SDM44816.1 Chitobiase/beta-hexosaminidase C-terminal domain-containing protein [Fictibacillus solisalsi]